MRHIESFPLKQEYQKNHRLSDPRVHNIIRRELKICHLTATEAKESSKRRMEHLSGEMSVNFWLFRDTHRDHTLERGDGALLISRGTTQREILIILPQIKSGQMLIEHKGEPEVNHRMLNDTE